MVLPEFFYLSPSPFSHRARWALEHYNISYTTTPYDVSPFYLTQLPLRWRIGRLRGVTAPILLIKQSGRSTQVIMDSTGIAKWAHSEACATQVGTTAGSSSSQDRGGAAQAQASLFPEQHAAEVDRWAAASHQLMSLFRRELTAAGVQHAAVRESLLPPALLRMAGPADSLLGRLLRWLMSKVFAMLSTKYSSVDAAADPDKVWQDLRAAGELLRSHPHRLLLPAPAGLSWADICLATALNKCAELQHKTVPGSGTGSTGGVQLHLQAAGITAGGQGAAPASSQASGCTAGQGRTVLSFLPQAQQLLQEFPDLVEWADATVRKFWPAGKDTLHGPAG